MFKTLGTKTCDVCGETRLCYAIDGQGTCCSQCYADALGHGYEVSEEEADQLFVEGFGRGMLSFERRTFNSYGR